jgi:hypothetical protein
LKFPEELFQPTATNEQRAAWETLDTVARRATFKRLSAIIRWDKPSGGITAAEAARTAGVGLSRFYKMAADWKDTGDLEVLGTIKARAGRRASKLDGEVVNALQAVVARVVSRNDGASVSHLVREMIDESGILERKPRSSLPSKMKLREIVEAELRRSRALTEAGHQIAFDCCAITWAYSPASPFCLFLVIDRGTRAILGHHLGVFDDDILGHAAAAANALEALDRLNLQWARTMMGIQIVIGADGARYAALVDAMEKDLGISAKTASTAGRFGRYVKQTIGPRMGQVVFAPGSTISGSPPPLVNGQVDVRPRHWVADAVASAIKGYNASEVPHVEATNGGQKLQPPATLVEVLQRISRSGPKINL